MKRFLVCVLCSVFLLSAAARADDERGPPPRYVIGNLIGDEKIALAMAEMLIREKHGEDVLKDNQPLTARRDGEFWVVEGKERKPMPLTTTIRISSVDARVDAFMVVTYAGPNVFVPMAMPECGAECPKAPAK